MESTSAILVLFLLTGSALSSHLLPHVFADTTSKYFIFYFSISYCFTFLIYKLIAYPFFLSPLKHLPEAKGFLPFVGHGLKFFERPRGAPHLKMMKETPNDGIILTRGIFHRNRLITTTPAALADVLVHKSYDFEKPPWTRPFLRKFLGEGILISEGLKHKTQRKQIMPAFHFRHIKNLYPVFWSKSVEFCNTVKASLDQDGSNVLEIGHYFAQATLDIIGLAGLGRDIGSLRNSHDELITNYDEILEPTTEKALFFLLNLVFPSWFMDILPWKLNERVKVTTGHLRRICRSFVAEKKLKMENENPGSQNSRDILAVMIRSGNFSDENLVEQLLTFIAAGHETSAASLTWASYLLSRHADVQERLRLEIHGRIPDPKYLSNPSFDVSGLLESMPYLNGVCNEVLRLFPPVTVLARVALRDTTVAGHFVPKDTMVFVVPWAINRNPLLWGPDSEDFVPERWINKETGRATMHGGTDSNFAFVTFLHGPRSCIGERFARAEMRTLLAAFVGSFEMKMANPQEEVVVGGTLASKPKNGMKLELRPVDWGT